MLRWVQKRSVGKSRALLFQGVRLESRLSGEFERAVEEIARDTRFCGIEIVRHAMTRAPRESRLKVIVDRDGGVDVATCERIAASINHRLGPLPDRYTLEVESAGLDRPLTKPGDYQRFSGRDAKIVTSLSVHGSKTHRGVLRGVRGTAVILQTQTGELPLPIETIKAANLEYDIRQDLRRNKQERRKYNA